MIKEIFLNLQKRPDKNNRMSSSFPKALRLNAVDGLNITKEDILPYIVDNSWRDPSSGRRFTKGEVGCVLSHIKAWKICSILDEPVIIFEDDVQLLDNKYQQLVQKYSNYDFLYLGYKDMQGECDDINHELKKPKFTYWCCGYYITPKVAQALLNYFETNPLIPADEVVPAILDIHRNSSYNQQNNFKVASFINPLVKPIPGAFDASDTEKSPPWQEFEFKIVSCGTDESKMQKILSDIDINIGKNVEWRGGTMQGPGGGQKVNLMKKYLSSIDEDTIVMFIDGYDTFISSNKETILERYLGFNKDIVFSAEKVCWPDKSLESLHPSSHTQYKYLNSGTYIGTVKALKTLFAAPIEDHEDDQLYMQKAFLRNQKNIALDVESYIFFCLAAAEKDIKISKNSIINSATNCTTCVIHGNGGEATKECFENLYNKWTGIKPVPLHNDIIVLPKLFTKKWCADLIEACEKENNWHNLPGDVVPGQEIRLNTLKDLSFREKFWSEYEIIVKRALEKYWPKLVAPNIRDLFVIKYSAGSQISLPLHHDMSLISSSIKLNDDYVGGVLRFPRQEVTNESLEVGDGVFWPAQVTHPHQSLPLESGTKYSLVLWTSRTKDEGEFYESR